MHWTIKAFVIELIRWRLEMHVNRYIFYFTHKQNLLFGQICPVLFLHIYVIWRWLNFFFFFFLLLWKISFSTTFLLSRNNSILLLTSLRSFALYSVLIIFSLLTGISSLKEKSIAAWLCIKACPVIQNSDFIENKTKQTVMESVCLHKGFG